MDLGKLLKTAPVKGEFAPTLPQLLAPRIDSLPRIVLRVIVVAVLVIAAAAVLLDLRLRNPVFSYAGSPSFSTTYSRTLTKEPTRAHGPILTLEQRSSAGLEASFQITTLGLPRYRGEVSGLLPVVASAMIARMEAANPTFLPYSRGRTRINLIPGYSFTYQETIGGRLYWGRDVLITPDITGDRKGLLLSMLTDPAPLADATKPVTPDSVGSVGVLFEPLQRLRFH
ncbi:MAG TPA: hypothetical protein VFC22_00935 [Solirubrobacteraceae bacterium]|jgi:hypothetical protein|nr:hypothetical protein [Solirubrobacteraceae bacterium]